MASGSLTLKTEPSRKSSSKASGWLSLPHLGDLLFLIVFAASLSPIRDYDIFWHLKTGEWIWEHSAVPQTDPFSWSMAGELWTAHEWLAEALFYGLWRFGGYAALIGLLSLLIAWCWHKLFQTSLAWAGKAPSAGLAAFLTALFLIPEGFTTWHPRPQILSLFLLLVLQGWVLQGGLSGVKGGVRLFALFVVWANLHGAWSLGWVFLALSLAGGWLDARRVFGGRAARRELASGSALLGTALLGAVVTPWGVHTLTYPFQYWGDTIHARILQEWQSPNFQEDWPLALILLALLPAIGVFWERREWRLFLPLGGFLYLTLKHQRMSLFLLPLAAPILAAGLSRWFESHRSGLLTRMTATLQQVPFRNRPPAFGMKLGAAGALTILILGWFHLTAPYELASGLYPDNAVRYWTQQGLSRHGMNFYAWGGYLMWVQGEPVFIDGRADVYAGKVLPDYQRIATLSPGWERLLEEYRLDAVLFPARTPLVEALRLHPGWRLVYEDRLAAVVVRKGE